MGKRKILVVDDRQVDLQLLRHSLAEDYEVLYAQDGAQALEILRADPETVLAVQRNGDVGQKQPETQCIADTTQQSMEAERFLVLYQPKYELVSERMTGAQVRVRRNHPEHGPLQPDGVIPPLAEKSYSAQPNRFVWERVCQDLHSWLQAGVTPVPVTVPLSGADMGLAAAAHSLVCKYQVPAELLHLEISEAVCAQQPQQAAETLAALRRHGFVIELADFGRACASLNLLAEMPLDIVKLDMHFIRQQAHKTTGQSILPFAVSLAKQRKLAVVAEGVETKEQLDLLRTIDCEGVQGFYAARPMEGAAFARLLSSCIAAGMLPVPVMQGSTAPAQQTPEAVRRAYLAQAVDKGTRLKAEMHALENYFEVVRLVDPEATTVHEGGADGPCSVHACFSVWGKEKRCNNCISLRALREHDRFSKLEYSEKGLFFVISQYVPVGEHGMVLELVTQLEEDYASKIFDRELLYLRLDELNQQLETDPLTGIYNRRHIDRHLESYIRHARRTGNDLGIAMADLDGLKKVNDTYGHLAGDAAIKTVAHLLESNITTSRGDFVARYGGDEFLIVCRGVSPDAFARLLRNMMEQIREEPVGPHGRLVGVSVGSVNLSEYPDKTAEQLVKHADERLYQAKGQGRGMLVSCGGAGLAKSARASER